MDVRTFSMISELVVLEHKFVCSHFLRVRPCFWCGGWFERHYVDARIFTHCDMDLSFCLRVWLCHHSPLFWFFQNFHERFSGFSCLKTDSDYESLSSQFGDSYCS